MIVFITIPWFSPAFRAGGPIQSIANLVDNFNKNIEYRIFCSNVDLNNEALQLIETNKWTDYNTHTKVFYTSADNVTKKLSREVNTIQPDVLFAIGLFSWPYNIYPILFCKVKKKILSVRGMLHAGALSQKKFKKKIFLSFFKILGIKKSITFHATNTDEANFIQQQFGDNIKIAVANNFAKKIIQSKPLQKHVGALKLITIALISPMKNHLLVLDALSTCEQNIEYNIYGPVKDAAYWQACLDKIKQLPKNIMVQYHGEINPMQVPEKLAMHHVFIMPSKSENFAHSIAEALCAGVPVITSNNTAWNNLQEANAGANVETDEASIAKAIQLFEAMDNEQFELCAKATLLYAQNYINNQALINQYEKLFALHD
jgi:glycosyltransferase involved in cell wall biosynthesis